MKIRIITTIIALSLFSVMPTWGQTAVIRRQTTDTKPSKTAGASRTRNNTSVSGGEYVDLGLPSGTLWATCNIGANKPEEYGDYFAWGETTGYKSGKREFKRNNYKWYGDSIKNMIKYYNTDKRNYKIHDYEELELEEDAAYVNMGNLWRIPSYAQMEELRSECTWISTTYKGVKGYIVKGRNGNSLFLPGAGACIEDHTPQDYRPWLYYWTRTLYENNTNCAYCLNYSYAVDNTQFRYWGCSIRPVRK